jgi:hypothetical protein
LFISKYVPVLTFHSAVGSCPDRTFKSPTPSYVFETFFILLAGFIYYNSLYTAIVGKKVVDIAVKHGFPYSGIQCHLCNAESSVAFVRMDKQVSERDRKMESYFFEKALICLLPFKGNRFCN